jgi:undecaprenyl pyrophosphate synthase
MALNPRIKALIIPLAISIPVLVIIGFFVFSTETEALSAEQILNKKDWTKEELSRSLAAAFSPQTNRRDRHKVLSHLRNQLKRYPKHQRTEIRVAALRKAINSSIDQMRLLPEEDRKKLLNAIQKRAEGSYSKVKKMTSKEKSKLRSRLNTSEGKAAVEEVNKVLISKLTPAERREFAPISKLWIKTLRTL